MREWWWRVRYAAWMWWIVPWLTVRQSWDCATCFEFEQVDGYTPREAVDEEIGYWTE